MATNRVYRGYTHFDDGRKWLRIDQYDDGKLTDCWDECISEWELVLDTTNGNSYYRHKTTKQVVNESRAYA